MEHKEMMVHLVHRELLDLLAPVAQLVLLDSLYEHQQTLMHTCCLDY